MGMLCRVPWCGTWHRVCFVGSVATMHSSVPWVFVAVAVAACGGESLFDGDGAPAAGHSGAGGSGAMGGASRVAAPGPVGPRRSVGQAVPESVGTQLVGVRLAAAHWVAVAARAAARGVAAVLEARRVAPDTAE